MQIVTVKFERLAFLGDDAGQELLEPEARAGIGAWIAFYNARRPHQALGNRPPMAVWRDGVTGALDQTAMDMTLRLDNADALTTCPQPPQQQQVRVA